MSNVQEYIIGALVDFTKGSKRNDPKYAELGKCRLAGIRHERVWTHIELEVTEGKRAGTIVKWKVRGMQVLVDLAPIAAKSSKQAIEKVHAAQDERYKKERAKTDRTFDLKIEAGDIVEVTDTRDKYKAPVRFRVYEVDYTKNRVKGWPDGTHYTRIGNRMGYYSTAHDNAYTFKIVEKKAFQVDIDPLWCAYKGNTMDAGAKRADTRARRSELRKMFGDY